MATATPLLPPLPRTLILDYYDSYTNNLLTLFTKLYSDTEVLRKVVVVKADRYTWQAFQEEVLPGIDCIILSPGPGSPDKPSDIGFALDLLRAHPVPILGVCLGHQAIGVAFGGKITHTPSITHGHVVPIAPVRPSLGLFASPVWKSAMAGEDRFDVVVYNSLTIDSQSLPDELDITAWSVATSDRPATVQGLAHKRYPIWGVQYHPESISSTRGSALLHSFLDAVHTHHASPKSYSPLADTIISSCSYRVASASRSISRPSSRPSSRPPSAWPTPPISPTHSNSPEPDSLAGPSHSLRMVERKIASGRDISTQDIFERVIRSRKGKERAVGEVWLDGETPTRSTTTSLTAPPFLFTYALASRTITLHIPTAKHNLNLEDDESFWDWFSEAQQLLSPKSTSQGKGWRCGWVGWFGYEMKEESLQGYRRGTDAGEKPEEVDACWAWTNWIVERDAEGNVSFRGLIDDSPREPPRQNIEDALPRPEGLVQWLDQLGIVPGLSSAEFDDLAEDLEATLSASTSSTPLVKPASAFPTFRPISNGEDYQSRIDMSRESIRQGDSYELTLTTAFTAALQEANDTATTPNPDADPYALYLRLRTFNPAYYSTYMSFPSLITPRGRGVHVLSSSPERFLRIERVDTASRGGSIGGTGGRMVEMMPIKGTRARPKRGVCVCRDGEGCGGKGRDSQGWSEACEAEWRRADEIIGKELEGDLKERAENLMIVDLIRADLLSCCLPSTVTVPKLIALESYGVHNLVTTVRGLLAENVGSVEAVRRCFPPGSMTGAPKLRSVQLLEGFESGRRRGIYSGALGYISVDGATDLSVVIRTIIVEGSSATIGAGGAITWLSKRANEWEEVKTKVKSVVGRLEE